MPRMAARDSLQELCPQAGAPGLLPGSKQNASEAQFSFLRVHSGSPHPPPLEPGPQGPRGDKPGRRAGGELPQMVALGDPAFSAEYSEFEEETWPEVRAGLPWE